VFAKYWTQDEKIKKLFYEKIEQKVGDRKQKMLDNIDESLPRILAVLAKPVAKVQFEMNRRSQENQGSGGEETISNTLWFWLPRNYRYFDDVVLEPEKDEFIQLDHIVIVPQGIFVVETKTWDGVIFASDNAWRLKQGKNWVKIENPVKQNERHVRLFRKWLKDTFPDKDFLQNIIYPVVALKKTSWFKAHESVKMPVVMGGLELVGYIKSIKGAFISDGLGKEICEKIEFTEPYKEKIKVQEGTTRNGKKFVRVYGTKEDAEKVAQDYKVNHKISEIRQDKSDPNVFFFYLD